ncbi:type II toxin-antitoxin system HigB family toxin [Salmonella enterica subsp. enterica serovar Uganda]|nr:type II toxin-antitoxin system HigB family toxin [Salmonella enterica]EAC1542092.1 type II toxin-antitoxin system HigB family toxin [Salmonella enterica subsp. enterica]EBO2751048.1 type II toxin-antitoxin system HigB family toxin [Salmonella enterica subsp. enterica serovar Agona]EDE1788941.1 hypothetical protein [Salmonella enterica subsp. enterica serovar Enteritidis]EEJ6011095.1 type II toxin-antitoxin system HigB family toxin [Salmonella enterica subsp. enterica serovar Meleagridis]EGC
MIFHSWWRILPPGKDAPPDIKALYRSASILKNRRVVFNIKGNDYQLTMLHFTLQPCNVICNISGFI